MNKRTKWISIIVGSVVLVAVVAGALAFGFTLRAKAQGYNPVSAQALEQFRGRGPGSPAGGIEEDTYLAEALGISVEELQAAREAANQAALDAAVEQGALTQEQADAMKVLELPFRFGFKGERFGSEIDIDLDALLADALGINVEELEQARQDARDAAQAEAIEAGKLTQEQADLMAARQALQSYLDPETLMANALGISVDTLQTYRESRMSMAEILEEVGMTAEEFRDAQQTARENAIQQAVADGAITQEQADLIHSGDLRLAPGFDCGPAGHGRRGMRGGFPGEMPGFSEPDFDRPGMPDTEAVPSTEGTGA